MSTDASLAILGRKVEQAEALTAAHPEGTPVEFWPGVREGQGRLGRVRSQWMDAPGGELVVFVEGYPSWIAATHVQPLAPVGGARS